MRPIKVFYDAQKAAAMGIGFRYLLQMHDTKMDPNFYALVASKFNPRFHRLKVDGKRHILVIESDDSLTARPFIEELCNSGK